MIFNYYYLIIIDIIYIYIYIFKLLYYMKFVLDDENHDETRRLQSTPPLFTINFNMCFSKLFSIC